MLTVGGGDTPLNSLFQPQICKLWVFSMVCICALVDGHLCVKCTKIKARSSIQLKKNMKMYVLNLTHQKLICNWTIRASQKWMENYVSYKKLCVIVVGMIHD